MRGDQAEGAPGKGALFVCAREFSRRTSALRAHSNVIEPKAAPYVQGCTCGGEVPRLGKMSMLRCCGNISRKNGIMLRYKLGPLAGNCFHLTAARGALRR